MFQQKYILKISDFMLTKIKRVVKRIHVFNLPQDMTCSLNFKVKIGKIEYFGMN
jgi:hypothetical protein